MKTYIPKKYFAFWKPFLFAAAYGNWKASLLIKVLKDNNALHIEGLLL